MAKYRFVTQNLTTKEIKGSGPKYKTVASALRGAKAVNNYCPKSERVVVTIHTGNYKPKNRTRSGNYHLTLERNKVFSTRPISGRDLAKTPVRELLK